MVMASSRRLAATVFVVVGMVAACESDTAMTTTDLSNGEAVQQLDAAFNTARIPDAFVPIRGISRTTNWGAEARTVEVAFNAPRSAVDAFIAKTGAGEHKWLKDASASCPPAVSTGGPVTSTPPDSILQGWYDRGVFQRCAVVEAWTIPAGELKNGEIHTAIGRMAKLRVLLEEEVIAQSIHTSNEAPRHLATVRSLSGTSHVVCGRVRRDSRSIRSGPARRSSADSWTTRGRRPPRSSCT